MIGFEKSAVKKTALFSALVIFLLISSFFYQLKAVSSDNSVKSFEIYPGEGFFEIVGRLESEKLIRSAGAFKVYSLLLGLYRKMKPGIYEISGALSSQEIAKMISGPAVEAEVMIPDGASVYDVDALLSKKKILPAGALISFAQKNDIEGKIYPDTYRFFEHTTIERVEKKFTDNFKGKADPILLRDALHYKSNLILASLVQKEVSDETDSKIIAGILKKRLAAGVTLDVDATICYLKKTAKGQPSCYPLDQSDFKIDSPYNTYKNIGLPPGPIGSPNITAIKAVLAPTPSPYWYYLSDPKTGETIFAKTLEEQSSNRIKYLK